MLQARINILQKKEEQAKFRIDSLQILSQRRSQFGIYSDQHMQMREEVIIARSTIEKEKQQKRDKAVEMNLQSAKKHIKNKAETEARNEQIKVLRANELIIVEKKIKEVKEEQ